MEVEKKVEKKTFIGTIEPVIFLPAFIIMSGCVILGFWKYDTLLNGLLTVYAWATENFSWTYAAITIFYLAVLLVIMVHPVGKLKLGGENAKPEYSTFNWFAITLCSTIGVSLIMWGSVEPIVHFVNPPAFSGVEPMTEAAATFALSTGYIHWSFNQYALYTFAAVAIAIAYFNHNQPLSVGSGMYFAVGNNKNFGRLSDALCLIVIVGGVATSLGIGIKQIAAGFSYAFNIESNILLTTIIAIALIASYTASSVSGIKKGITFTSRTNVRIFFFLLIFTYFAGPTIFINELSLQSLGEFLTTGLKRSLILAPISGDSWPGDWTINFYVANAAYAPLMGVFLAKLGRGRTLRQFIGMNLGVCSVFNIVWFNIFGGAAIYQQLYGLDIASIMAEKGLESAAYAFFSTLPLGEVIIPIFTVAVFLSFLTMGDSLSTSMAAISMKGGMMENEEEPNTLLKITWAIFVGVLGYLLLGLVGVDVIKYTYMVFGFPIFIILGIMGYSLVKGLFFPNFSIKESIKNNIK